MALTSALLLITLALGILRTLGGVADTPGAQIATLVLLTTSTVLTLHQQVGAAISAAETQLQIRFLLDSAKPTPDFFNRLRFAAAVALKGHAFHHLQDERFGNAWAVPYYAEDRTLRYFYLFTPKDLTDLMLVPPERLS